MEIKANLNHLRMSPQKVRLVADLVRKAPLSAALDQLKFINKKAAEPLTKVLKSAAANAVNTYDLDKNNLYIKTLTVDEGVTLKRWFPRAHGRATSIRKRACHIHVVLDEITPSGKGVKKEAKLEKPVKLEKIAKDAENKIAKKGAVSKAKAIEDGEAKGGKGFASKVFHRKSG